MSRRQLVALFICTMIQFALGNAQLGLLSIYLTQLGVDPAAIGNYLALIFFAVVVGTFVAGWLSDRYQRRKTLFVVLTAAQVPFALLVSQTTQVWLVVTLLVISSLLAGTALALANILAGLFARDNERGKVFGILGVAVNVGAMLGGLLVGFVVQRWGFGVLFAVVGAVQLMVPIAGSFLEDKNVVPERARTASAAQTGLVLGVSFYLLLIACFLLNTSGAVTGLGRPLIMAKLGFDNESIASVITVGGAVGIPVPLLLGWLSDRLGRSRLLLLSFLAAGAGCALVAVSAALWHYWFAALLAAGIGSGNAIASALVTDLVPPQGLSKALSRLNAINWAGEVAGFAITGYVIESFGLTNTLLIGGLLPVLGILLLVRLRTFQPSPVPG